MAQAGIRREFGGMTEHSKAYRRLRHYIVERIRMSHIYQPLMLMELLGRAVRPQLRTSPVGSWAKT